MALQVRAMLDFHRQGVPTLDYGNNIRQFAKEMGVANAFEFPGFVPAYLRPLFCRGKGPFRWAALSGDPADIASTDAKVKVLIPDDSICTTGSTSRPSGSPSRVCRRASAGWAWASGRGSASPSTRWSRAASSAPRS